MGGGGAEAEAAGAGVVGKVAAGRRTERLEVTEAEGRASPGQNSVCMWP